MGRMSAHQMLSLRAIEKKCRYTPGLERCNTYHKADKIYRHLQAYHHPIPVDDPLHLLWTQVAILRDCLDAIEADME